MANFGNSDFGILGHHLMAILIHSDLENTGEKKKFANLAKLQPGRAREKS